MAAKEKLQLARNGLIYFHFVFKTGVTMGIQLDTLPLPSYLPSKLQKKQEVTMGIQLDTPPRHQLPHQTTTPHTSTQINQHRASFRSRHLGEKGEGGMRGLPLIIGREHN